MGYEYKNSGIEWIGIVPIHWKRDKLFRLSEKVGSGGTPKSSNQNFYGGNIPWIQSGDLTDAEVYETSKTITEEGLNNSSAKIFTEGTLLVAMYGATIGKVGIMKMDAAINQACCAIQPSKKLDPQYLYYLLLNMRNYLVTQSYGGGQTNISQEIIKQQMIFPPPLREQKAIAKYLDKACARIDRVIEIKEKQVERIDLALKKKINEIIISGLGPAPTKMVRADFIGKIPKHYRIHKLKHISSQITDGTHHTPTYLEYGKDVVPFLRVTDIHKEKIQLEKLKYISKEEHQELIKRCKPERGDLLLSKNGTIGVTKVVDWDYEFSVFVSLALIKPEKEHIDVEYLNYYFQSEIMEYQMSQASKQITVTNLHLEKIRDFLIVTPPLNEQKLLVEKLKNVRYKIDVTKKNIENQLKTLKNYRKSLIHECVTGKKQVFFENDKMWEKETAAINN